MPETIAADYLVVGAGAMGMAFVDTLLSDTSASIVIVDRYARPGGHWTIAYPFVRLHQPSAFYGVNSRPLGENKIDEVGLNRGLAELATVDEVCGYFSIVMHRTFLSSGRVKYFPKHEYTGDGEFRSIITGQSFRVGDTTRLVDATYMKVKVPAMGTPSYEVANEVDLVTPNDLTKVTRPYGGYTVVGAGKTGIDACLWLLANGVDRDKITWIMPRDSWFFERGALQPGPAFAETTAASVAAVNKSMMDASSLEDLFFRLEDSKQVLRMTKDIWPTMFRCATVSIAELEQLNAIGTIVRQGRVVRIEPNVITLEQGTHKAAADTLYIDCSADALARLEAVPVFRGRTITLQSVRYCQQVFSAALIAHVEATYGQDDATKNDMCRVVPHPDETSDYLTMNLQSHENGLKWASQPQTAKWLSQARLDWFGTLLPPAPTDPEQATAFYAAVAEQVQALCRKLEHLTTRLPEREAARAKVQMEIFRQ